MIITIKTTIAVIKYYLKRNTNNEAKLHVDYISWLSRLQFLFTFFSELLHGKFEKNLEECKNNI